MGIQADEQLAQICRVCGGTHGAAVAVPTAVTPLASSTWGGWLAQHDEALKSGAKLRVPAQLPHPGVAGFDRIYGLSRGQAADWAFHLGPNGRYHVWEFGDGRMVVHWDQFDPREGVEALYRHAVREVVPAIASDIWNGALDTAEGGGPARRKGGCGCHR